MFFRIFLSLALFISAAAAQDAPAAPSPDKVLATLEGKPITSGEIQAMVDAMGPQMRQFYAKDPKEFIRQYALQSKLAGIALSEKLDQESPYKERLRYSREAVLMQSLMDRRMNATPITDEEIAARHQQMGGGDATYQTKVLYVSFGGDGASGRPEAEAKTKIEDLRKKAAAGEDFVALLKSNSDDQISRDKDGDYPAMRKSDPLPEPVKAAVFALKPGELTEPIRQANGYYVFRLEKIDTKPLSEVREQIVNQIRQERFNSWFQEQRKALEVKFEDEPPTAAAPAKP